MSNDYLYNICDFIREQYEQMKTIRLHSEEIAESNVRNLEMRIKELRQKAETKKPKRQAKIIKLRIAN